MDDGLGFRERDALVYLSSNKQERRPGLPRFRPSKGNTLLPACLFLIINEDYNVVVMAMVVYIESCLGQIMRKSMSSPLLCLAAPPSLYLGG
jgi:hypothetical protein